jgi:hypothetical protein
MRIVIRIVTLFDGSATRGDCVDERFIFILQFGDLIADIIIVYIIAPIIIVPVVIRATCFMGLRTRLGATHYGPYQEQQCGKEKMSHKKRFMVKKKRRGNWREDAKSKGG